MSARTDRLVVIGADAAGMTAATTAKRLAGDALEVVVLECGRWTSYSACGIPYWVAGDVADADDLVARSPQAHRANGLDVRLHTEAVALDLAAGTVAVRGADGEPSDLGFDRLVVATGAAPVRLDLPGADAAGIHGVQSLQDGCDLIDRLTAGPRSAVIVGGGYIGVEMAEACLRRKLTTTLLDSAAEPMRTLDPELGARVREAMTAMGIDVRTGVAVNGFETSHTGGVRAVSTDDGEIDADVVILALGVRPRSELARGAGLPLGAAGGMRTDASMAVDGHPHLYAAGDCVESWDRVRQSWVHVPLGTHANKQGRVAGLNLAGGRARFPGIVGTAITKVCDLEIARTGLSEGQARDEGFDAVAATITTTNMAGYLPAAEPMTVKMVAERASRRLLGAQIVGRVSAGLRIDTCALALWTRLTVDELAFTDLAYAPPFSSVWDPVQVAARAVATALDG
ncbi:MAG: FAD-dependent oxidoreductase [Nocardioidaceae bacterium]